MKSKAFRVEGVRNIGSFFSDVRWKTNPLGNLYLTSELAASRGLRIDRSRGLTLNRALFRNCFLPFPPTLSSLSLSLQNFPSHSRPALTYSLRQRNWIGTNYGASLNVPRRQNVVAAGNFEFTCRSLLGDPVLFFEFSVLSENRYRKIDLSKVNYTIVKLILNT